MNSNYLWEWKVENSDSENQTNVRYKIEGEDQVEEVLVRFLKVYIN